MMGQPLLLADQPAAPPDDAPAASVLPLPSTGASPQEPGGASIPPRHFDAAGRSSAGARPSRPEIVVTPTAAAIRAALTGARSSPTPRDASARRPSARALAPRAGASSRADRA